MSEVKRSKGEEVTLSYFQIRGRGEPIRLMLELNGVAWKEDSSADFDEVLKPKSGSAALPFGQLPLIKEGATTTVQMDAIMRKLGRKHGQYVGSDEELTTIDMILGGVEALRSVYGALIYRDELAEEAKAKYFKTHLDTSIASVAGSNDGAHLMFLENFIVRGQKTPKQVYAIRDTPTIADVQLSNIYDLHLRIFGDVVKKNYPHLQALHDAFSHIPNIAAYLKSERIPKAVNGNGMG